MESKQHSLAVAQRLQQHVEQSLSEAFKRGGQGRTHIYAQYIHTPTTKQTSKGQMKQTNDKQPHWLLAL